MNQKKHYYLIDGKIMKSSIKMPPTRIAVTEGHAKTEALKHHYQELYSRWRHNLQICEIIEVELDKVYESLCVKYIVPSLSYIKEPIEVTSIVYEKFIDYAVEDDHDSSFKTQIFFKESEKESEDLDKIWTELVISVLNKESNGNPWIKTLEDLKSKFTINRKNKINAR